MLRSVAGMVRVFSLCGEAAPPSSLSGLPQAIDFLALGCLSVSLENTSMHRAAQSHCAIGR